jgi:hypothetical protein
MGRFVCFSGYACTYDSTVSGNAPFANGTPMQDVKPWIERPEGLADAYAKL